MLSSLSPVGERARGQRWGVTATAYLLGALLGGAAVGWLAGGLGQLLLGGIDPSARSAAVGLVALLGVLLDRTRGVPSPQRQVDERWLTRYRGWVYGAGFGVQLGTGVATIIPSSVVYAMWIGTALTGSAAAGSSVGLVFGAARATPLLLAGRIRTVGALRRALARMDRARHRIAGVTPALQGIVGMAAVLAGITTAS